MTTQTQAQPQAGITTWKIDPAHTLVEVAARHMMITTVKGRFGGVEGSIRVDGDHPDRSGAQVDIDAASISTGVGQRDDHLKSADFLDVARYPKITFVSSAVNGAHASEGDTFTVVGDLHHPRHHERGYPACDLRGPGEGSWGGERVAFTADTTIDRRQFGLTWNQALETGGVLVGNQLKIHLEVQAVKS